MQKTILITGSTDGLGLATARALAAEGHRVLLHGRSAAKLEAALRDVAEAGGGGEVPGFLADLSRLDDVERLADEVAAAGALDVLINNAGVYRLRDARTASGLDARFAVNTIAPYVLARRLAEHLGATGRVVNLSSAAQAPVDVGALAGAPALSDDQAYAQSKLALTMWSSALARDLGDAGPAIIAVNPGSFLGTKMVKEAYGMQGADVAIGVDVLRRAALSEEFAAASGRYYDNDNGRFADPHPDALDGRKVTAVVEAIEAALGGDRRDAAGR